MKKIYAMIFFIFFINALNAQLNLNWAYSFGSTFTINNYATIFWSDISMNNSIVSCGSADSTVDFDPGPGVVTLNNLWWEFFISKYDSAANLVFAKPMLDTAFAGYPTCVSRKIICDKIGNFYLILGLCGPYLPSNYTGIGWNIAGAMTIDSIQKGKMRYFIIKFDGSGNCLFVKKMANNVYINDAIIDNNDDLIMCGNFSGTKDLAPGPPVQVFSTTEEDAFVTKLDSSGIIIYINVIHCTDAGAGGYALINPGALTVDSQDNLFFGLGMQGVYDIDPGIDSNIVTAPYDPNGVWGNTLLVKWDSTGNFVFRKKFFRSGFGFNISIDEYDKLYLWGLLGDYPVDIDPGPDTVMLTSTDYLDAVIAKFNNNGTYVISKQITGNDWQEIEDFHITKNNKYYLLGLTRDDSTAFASLGIPNIGQSSPCGKRVIIQTDSLLNGFYFQTISNSCDSEAYFNSGLLSDLDDNFYLFGGYTGVFDADLGAGVYNLNNPFALQPYSLSCVISKYATANSPVNVYDNEDFSSVIIFPNPADEYSVISYRFAVGDIIRVTNVLGKIIFTKTVEAPASSLKLQTIHYTPGIYFVELIVEGEKMVKKMVKQ